MLRSLHLALALAVLVSTSGVVLTQHLCGDVVRSTGVFAAAEHCPHAQPATPACPNHPPTASADEEAKGCCDDRAQLTKTDHLLDLVPATANLLTPALALPPAQVMFARLADPTPVETWAARHYRPPPRSGPARSALQVFRC